MWIHLPLLCSCDQGRNQLIKEHQKKVNKNLRLFLLLRVSGAVRELSLHPVASASGYLDMTIRTLQRMARHGLDRF